MYTQDKKLNKFIKYLSEVTQHYILKSSDDLRSLDLSILELTASNTPLYISVEPRTKIQYCANQSPKTNQYCHIRHVCSKPVEALADFSGSLIQIFATLGCRPLLTTWWPIMGSSACVTWFSLIGPFWKFLNLIGPFLGSFVYILVWKSKTPYTHITPLRIKHVVKSSTTRGI